MRKSFTQLISIFMLISVFGFQALASWDGTGSLPQKGNPNVMPSDIVTQFVVAFSGAPTITAAGGTMAVYKEPAHSIIAVIPIKQSSTNVQVVGNKLVVNHGIASFPEETQYSIALTAGTVTVGGTSEGAIVSNTTTKDWTFTTGDFTAPKLVSSNPLSPVGTGTAATMAIAGGDAGTFNLTMTFNEDVKIGSGKIAIYNAEGTVVELMDVQHLITGAQDISISGAVVTIKVDAAARFEENTTYYVKVDAGAFTDDVTAYNAPGWPAAVPNKYAGIDDTTSWTFTTRDNSAPVISDASVSGITISGATLSVTIAEAGKVSYKVQLASAADPDAEDYTGFSTPVAVSANTAKTFALSGLTGGMQYEVFVVAENNLAPANKTAANAKKVTFTTVDETGPVALSRDQIYTDKKTTGAYIIFNEQVTNGTGTLFVKKVADNKLIASVPASAVTFAKVANSSNWKASIDFGVALDSKEHYYIVFPKGYIKDIAGNAYGDDVPGIAVPLNYTDWVITSGDFEAPVVTYSTTTVSPAVSGNITGAANTDNIMINFDEDVALVDGTAWTSVSDWSKYFAFQKNGVTVAADYSFDASNNVLTINPFGTTASVLESNTAYTVIIRPGVIEDKNANVITAGKSVTVTTGDNDIFTVWYGSSEGKTTVSGLNGNSTLVVAFSKAVFVNTTSTTWVAANSDNIKPFISFKKNGTAQSFAAAFDATANTLTITPAQALVSNATDYTLVVDGAKVRDSKQMLLSSATNYSASVTYTIKDYKKPVASLVASYTVGDDLTITFDEPVSSILNGGFSKDQLTLKKNGAQGANYSFDAALSGETITISNISPALAVGDVFYYGIGSSMKDGATVPNINDPVYGTFTVQAAPVPATLVPQTYTVNGGSTAYPIGTNVAPATGVESVSGNLTFVVTFNQAISLSSAAPSTSITLTDGTNTYPLSVPLAQASIDGSKLTLKFNPGTLSSLTNYVVNVPAGWVVANATNSEGVYASQQVFSFTVKSKDTVVPYIVSTTPANTATGVALDWGTAGLTLTFSEKVALGSGNITITPAGGTAITIPVNSSTISLEDVDTPTLHSVATITAADLALYSTSYTVAVDAGAFKDMALNSLGNNGGANPLSFSFTTEANTPPTVETLNPEDEADAVTTSLDLVMTFSKPVAKTSEAGTSRKVVYVIKYDSTDGNTGHSVINGNGDLVLASGESQVYSAYVDDDNKVGVSGNTVTIKGVSLEAGSFYYVLITPDAFKDLSEGVGTPGYYAGISAFGAWNFTTKIINAPDVVISYTKLGADGLVATDSDIKLTFSRAIVNTDGSAISDSEISSKPLVTLNNGTQNLAFTASISPDKKTITIDNSSLVVLNEMVGNHQYTLTILQGNIKGADGGNVLGATPFQFWTTDNQAPTFTTANIVYRTPSEVDDISYNTTDGHVVKLSVTGVTDVNSGLAGHTGIKVYYLRSATQQTLAASDVKGLADGTIATGNGDITYKGDMTSATTYYIYAVAEDAAGNLSAVVPFSFITDDVVAPQLASSTLPTAAPNGVVSLAFNEKVVPAATGKARVIDSNGVTSYVALAQGADAKTIKIDFSSIVAANSDVTSYTIEIDPAQVYDVPRQVSGTNVNDPNAWAGITGTSFVVSTTDKEVPVLVDPTYSATKTMTDVDTNPAFKLTFSEPVKLAAGFTSLVINDNADDPYDLITADNISGLGTSTITMTPARAFVGEQTYKFTIPSGMFTDMSGNAWTEGNIAVTFTVKDVTPLDGVFSADLTELPADAFTTVPTSLKIAFGETFKLNPDDPTVNTYDLQSHVYLKQGNSDISFVATVVDGGQSILLSNLNGSGLGDAAKGKTYTFGYTDLYDNTGLVNAGQEASFSVAEDAIVPWKVKFTPGDNDADPTTKVQASVDQTFQVEFNGIIFSYSNVEADNNLIMSASLLKDLGVFSLSPMASGATLNIVSYSEASGNSIVTLQSSKPLLSQTVVTLTLNADKIQIGQGHTPLATYTETFSTDDVTAPTLVSDVDGAPLASSYLPNNGGTVGKDQTLGLVFTEPVVGVGSAEIHRWDGVLVATVNLAGKASATAAPYTLNIAKISDLMTSENPEFVTNEKYYIIVPAGAVVDKATTPNAYAGITGINEWTIDLRDDAHPVVTFVDNAKMNISVDTDIKLTFDRPVDGNWGFLAIYTEDGNAVQLLRVPPTATGVDGVTSYNISIDQLAQNTKYLLELGEGSFVLHADGTTPQLGIAKGEWWFSTEINSKPVVEEYVPANTDPMTTNVELSSDLVLTFDQDVAAGTGNIQLMQKQEFGGPIITNFDVTDATKVIFNGNTVTIPSAVLGLQENSEYYVIIPGTAIKNTSLTPEYYDGITVPFTWSFSTVTDGTAPSVVTLKPNAVEDLAPAGVKLTAIFDEAVQAGTGNITVYNAENDTVVATFDVADVTFDADSLTTPVIEGLVDQTSYYVTVDAGAVLDMAVVPNAFAGISDKTTWAFSTGDFTAPELVSATPTGTLTDNHPTFVMTFNEDVKLGSGNLVIVKKDGAATALTIPVSGATVDGNTVTVTYAYDPNTGGLDQNTEYYVLVDAGAILDTADNAFAGVSDATAWTFTTGKFATPVTPVIGSLEFKVYPNPFVDYVTVANASQLTKIVVSNIAGQVVKEVVNPTDILQLNELRSGVYFISMYQSNKVIETAKVVKR